MSQGRPTPALCVAVVFAVLAATSEQEQRGAFIGLAILWTVMAGAAGAG